MVADGITGGGVDERVGLRVLEAAGGLVGERVGSGVWVGSGVELEQALTRANASMAVITSNFAFKVSSF
jgi:hypothetical protein